MLRFLRRILPCLCLLMIAFQARAQQPVVVITSFSAEVSNYLHQQLSKQLPEFNLRFINKKTPAVLTHLEKNLYPRPDLVIVSAPDAFDWLNQQGQLTPLLPQQPLKYTPFAYSGYGLMINRQYMQEYQLREPKRWEDLLQTEYRGHIAMTTPSRSGTTHVIVETLLQDKGWNQGWAYLLQLAGNLTTITARSFGVRQGVINQRFGLGLSIDFFAFTAQYDDPDIHFVYPAPSVFLPASAGLVKDGPNPEAARQLVSYLLTTEGQRMLLAPELSRFPVNQQVLNEQPEHLLNTYLPSIQHSRDYDSQLAVKRYQLVNALFDELITLRLDFLQQSWSRLESIRQRLDLSPQPEFEPAYAAIRQDLVSIPFDADQLDNLALLGSFTQVLPGAQLSETQLQEMERWRQWSRQQQDRITHQLSVLKHQLDGVSRGTF